MFTLAGNHGNTINNTENFGLASTKQSFNFTFFLLLSCLTCHIISHPKSCPVNIVCCLFWEPSASRGKLSRMMSDDEDQPLNISGDLKVSIVFPNGDKYEGESSRSASGALVRSGTGRHTSLNGLVYTGEWCEDKMEGKGTLQHPSGATYEGEFRDNMFHGSGTYVFPDTSVYRGQFHKNRLEGEGTFTDAQGLVWTGEFHDKEALGLKLQHSI